MDCEISAKNAKILEKMCQVFKSEYLIIDTLKDVKFQLLSDSKNVISTLILEKSFFTKFENKTETLKINKPKFYYTKMLFLKITTTSTFVIFEYNFEFYIYRHKFCIFRGELFFVPFVINASEYVDQFSFYKAIELASGTIKFSCEEEFAFLKNDNINVKFQCKGLDKIYFEMDSVLLKSIFSLYEFFDSCLLNWEEKDSPININLYYTTYSIYFFVGTT